MAKNGVRPIDTSGEIYLYCVMTINEASRIFGVSIQTLHYHINIGNIAARKSGGVWLLSVLSLLKYYQLPPMPETVKKIVRLYDLD